MHATLVAHPFHHDGWVYEEKVDGYRMVAVKANGAVQLISRAGRDHTKRFGELAQSLAGLKPKTVILDGEVAVFDRDLVSRFEWLRARPKDEPATESVDIAFDVLELDGKDLRPLPLRERRRVLERLVNHHAMFSPETAGPHTPWTADAPCYVCSFWMDNFNGVTVHLNHRDITMAAVSRAPYPKLAAYKGRMGWSFPWLSSLDSDFNFDYRVSFTQEELRAQKVDYNYRPTPWAITKAPGISVFLKDGG